jgi:uncharacterized protein with PIN domain
MMKFIADGMLGKLARWLRLGGYDVIYIGDLAVPPHEQDDTLLHIARSEGRVLLTCDIDLYRRAKRAGISGVFIQSTNVVNQLVEVSRRGKRIRIRPENSRCPICNGLLRRANKTKIGEKVPAAVLKKYSEFWECKSCGKIYWPGTHWQSILEMAQQYTKIIGSEG